ncbi:hypothetical protein QAD02_010567 [Eretmocerus hayati]|uniref:Uncharacterized protein n=1 Tax=Eretmocerus hayati TaxID=131215 RepID=A0ACC2NUE7_9HYME|nr:hypothetical protein QAD02_010567 [Eretmocerus hayati]
MALRQLIQAPWLLLLLVTVSQALDSTSSIPSSSEINISALSPTSIPTPCPPCPSTTTGNATIPSHHHQPPSAGAGLLVHGMKCLCHVGAAAKDQPARDDYRYSPGIGAHKLHTRAATWNQARKTCNEEGGHLAIVNSFIEAHVLMDIFNKSSPVKGASYTDLAFVGIHDMYKEGEWVTILGDSLFKTGYTIWSEKWGGQPDNGGTNADQHCGVFLKEGGLDDVNCDVPFAFFCELPMTYIMP